MFIRSITLGSLLFAVSGCGGSETNGSAPTSEEASGGSAGAITASGGAETASGGSAGGIAASGGAETASGGSAVATGGAPGAGGASPIAGTQQTVFTMDTFQVPVGGEYYKCQDFPNTFGGNIAVLESESVMTVGSHHMFVFRLSQGGLLGGTPNLGANNTKGPLVDCPSGGTEFHPYVHAAQSPTQIFMYPPGIGQAFNSDETPRLMVHYLNTQTTAIQANVTVTLNYVPADQVQTLAASFFLNSISVRVPPGMSTQSFSYALTQDINVLAASGHMHRRGVQFNGSFTTADGTTNQLYQTNTWNEPTAAQFNPATPIASGSTLNWACTYNNTTSMTFTFGESAQSNEMCIFTGTYYPAPGGNGLYDVNATSKN